MRVIDELMSRSESLSEGEGDYLDALARFTADWERAHVLKKLGQASPQQVLQHLMQAHGMTPADLGQVIGSRSAASMILKGQREMSKAHIRAVAKRFNVNPALFL